MKNIQTTRTTNSQTRLCDFLHSNFKECVSKYRQNITEKVRPFSKLQNLDHHPGLLLTSVLLETKAIDQFVCAHDEV